MPTVFLDHEYRNDGMPYYGKKSKPSCIRTVKHCKDSVDKVTSGSA